MIQGAKFVSIKTNLIRISPNKGEVQVHDVLKRELDITAKSVRVRFLSADFTVAN